MAIPPRPCATEPAHQVSATVLPEDEAPPPGRDLGVPVRAIPRLRYPDDLTPERFEQDFAGRSEPCIIEGLVDDWPAYADDSRTWRGSRWDDLLSSDTVLDCGFDPADNRMMHFGDDTGEPNVLFNPGRLRMPAWAFLEVARLRQRILQIHREEGGSVNIRRHPDLKMRLNKAVTVQNIPFLSIDDDSPLHFFAPMTCRMADLVPLSFYLSHDTYSLPGDLQEDLGPQAPKLIEGWASPNSSRVWATNGGPWRLPFPPWSEDSVPTPGEDPMIYSCFHCDRMENFHSVIAGEKQVVLVPPGRRDVLKSTRYSVQRQWLVAPVAANSGDSHYLGTTLFTSKQMECTSDQSAVHPFRSADLNRRVSAGEWPDRVDFPVRTGTLRKGDTLYIPAYHWHWVATTTPPSLGHDADGALALSVNFWWWPIHNDAAMESWSFQNEVESLQNARVPVPIDRPPLDREGHMAAFYQLTLRQRHDASMPSSWPTRASSTISARGRQEQTTPAMAARAGNETAAGAAFHSKAKTHAVSTAVMEDALEARGRSETKPALKAGSAYTTTDPCPAHEYLLEYEIVD